MTNRENMLRCVRFERPDRIPMGFHINGACWNHYPQDALQDLMAAHKLLFPGHKKKTEKTAPKFPGWCRAGQCYTDDWGCVWQTAMDGITGTVVKSPLENWADFEGYKPPSADNSDGMGKFDWKARSGSVARAREKGDLVQCSLRHGHTFMTLMYIRGYENLVFDMTDNDPRLRGLIEMVETFNAGLVRRFLELGVEWVGYPEDLGMQTGPLISPDHFREFIKPVYKRLIEPARKAGCVAHMHSDGDIRVFVEDLLDCGVDVLNLQDLVNGISWIKEHLRGRVCIDLDVDRQSTTRFGAPGDVDALIRSAVEELSMKEGGLMLTYGLYPGVPLENVEALMDAMEKYAGFHA